MINQVREAIEKKAVRGSWNKGVKVYALELLDNVTEEDMVNNTMLKKALLNGAGNWQEYSYGGCSLIYDRGIAERLCNPSELKRTMNGKRRPNIFESWMDVQTRALYQACQLIISTVCSLK